MPSETLSTIIKLVWTVDTKITVIFSFWISLKVKVATWSFVSDDHLICDCFLLDALEILKVPSASDTIE